MTLSQSQRSASETVGESQDEQTSYRLVYSGGFSNANIFFDVAESAAPSHAKAHDREWPE